MSSSTLLVAVAALTLSCVAVGCASSTESTDEQSQDVGAPQALSYVGEAVVSALDAKHPNTNGRVWSLSRDNALSGDFVVQVPPKSTFGQDHVVAAPRCTGGDHCDADLGLYTCEQSADCTGGSRCVALQATIAHRGQEAANRCIGDADVILDEVWSGIALAQKTVDISSLSAPDGRYEATVRNAVTYLSEQDSPPRVRMLFGNFPGEFSSAARTLASLTRDVRPESTIDVHVANYRAGLTSWNHSKIVSRDGAYTLMGSANMWDAHYLGTDPVHDLWIKVSGTAAGDASRYLDELWSFACSGFSFGDSKDVASRDGSNGCPAMFGAGPAVKAAGNKPVVAVGRLGAIGEEPSDDAIVAMIDASKSSVHLSQQDIGPIHKGGISFGVWPEATMLALISAMDRNVDVSITLSNTGAVPGDVSGLSAEFNGYDNGWTPAEVAQQFATLASAHPEAHPAHADATALVCEKLTLMRLRSSDAETWSDGRTLANHAKVVVVDDRAFYNGSQNTYVANLAEFGVIVDDPTATKSFIANYLGKVESYSKRTAVTGPGVACVLAR